MAAALGASCSLFTDLSGLSSGGGGGADASDHDVESLDDASPTRSPDASARSDAAVASDAGASDADVVVVPDSGEDASTVCTGSPLAGSNDLAGTVDDVIVSGIFDTYGYIGRTSGVARCAWLYVAAPSSDIELVVYADDGTGTAPHALLARATLSPSTVGWNSAPLDVPVTTTAGNVLWIGFSALGPDGAHIRSKNGCQTPLSLQAGQGANGAPPDPFVLSKAYPGQCDGAAYLTR